MAGLPFWPAWVEWRPANLVLFRAFSSFAASVGKAPVKALERVQREQPIEQN